MADYLAKKKKKQQLKETSYGKFPRHGRNVTSKVNISKYVVQLTKYDQFTKTPFTQGQPIDLIDSTRLFFAMAILSLYQAYYRQSVPVGNLGTNGNLEFSHTEVLKILPIFNGLALSYNFLLQTPNPTLINQTYASLDTDPLGTVQEEQIKQHLFTWLTQHYSTRLITHYNISKVLYRPVFLDNEETLKFLYLIYLDGIHDKYNGVIDKKTKKIQFYTFKGFLKHGWVKSYFNTKEYIKISDGEISRILNPLITFILDGQTRSTGFFFDESLKSDIFTNKMPSAGWEGKIKNNISFMEKINNIFDTVIIHSVLDEESAWATSLTMNGNDSFYFSVDQSKAETNIFGKIVQANKQANIIITPSNAVDPGQVISTPSGYIDAQLIWLNTVFGRDMNSFTGAYDAGPTSFELNLDGTNKFKIEFQLPSLESPNCASINPLLSDIKGFINRTKNASSVMPLPDNIFCTKLNGVEFSVGSTKAQAKAGSDEDGAGKYLADGMQYYSCALLQLYRQENPSIGMPLVIFCSGDGMACFLFLYFCSLIGVKYPCLIIDKSLHGGSIIITNAKENNINVDILGRNGNQRNRANFFRASPAAGDQPTQNFMESSNEEDENSPSSSVSVNVPEKIKRLFIQLNLGSGNPQFITMASNKLLEKDYLFTLMTEISDKCKEAFDRIEREGRSEQIFTPFIDLKRLLSLRGKPITSGSIRTFILNKLIELKIIPVSRGSNVVKANFIRVLKKFLEQTESTPIMIDNVSPLIQQIIDINRFVETDQIKVISVVNQNINSIATLMKNTENQRRYEYVFTNPQQKKLILDSIKESPNAKKFVNYIKEKQQEFTQLQQYLTQQQQQLQKPGYAQPLFIQSEETLENEAQNVVIKARLFIYGISEYLKAGKFTSYNSVTEKSDFVGFLNELSSAINPIKINAKLDVRTVNNVLNRYGITP